MDFLVSEKVCKICSHGKFFCQCHDKCEICDEYVSQCECLDTEADFSDVFSNSYEDNY